jgi:Domain of unknown function (DUF397)
MDQQDLTSVVWRKSSVCADGDSCVEVAHAGGRVSIRDSKDDGKGPVLVLGDHQWRTFITCVRAGQYNL